MRTAPPCITTPYSFLVCTAVFSTLLSRSLMPKNTSAAFVTQKQNWEKKQKTSFIELPAIWLRNTTPRGELLAQLSLGKCVLSVPDWVCIWVCIAHLHSSPNTWSLIFLQLAFHMWYRCPPTCCSLLNTRKPSLTQFKFTSLWLGFVNYVMDGFESTGAVNMKQTFEAAPTVRGIAAVAPCQSLQLWAQKAAVALLNFE